MNRLCYRMLVIAALPKLIYCRNSTKTSEVKSDNGSQSRHRQRVNFSPILKVAGDCPKRLVRKPSHDLSLVTPKTVCLAVNCARFARGFARFHSSDFKEAHLIGNRDVWGKE